MKSSKGYSTHNKGFRGVIGRGRIRIPYARTTGKKLVIVSIDKVPSAYDMEALSTHLRHLGNCGY